MKFATRMLTKNHEGTLRKGSPKQSTEGHRMINTIKNLLKKEKTTKVRVIVEYETEYDGHINENDIDFTDVFEPDNIKNVKKVSLRKKG